MSSADDNDNLNQLTAVRLILSLCVVWTHWLQIFLFSFGLVSAGFYSFSRECADWSVVIFFGLSGLVIGRSLQRRRQQGDLVFPSFMLSRFLRIYPALLFSVVLCVALGLVLAVA